MTLEVLHPASKNKQALAVKYGLPETVQFCKKCVISNQRPNSVVETQNKASDRKATISFVEGVCSACHYAERKQSIDWLHREQQLRELCRQYRSKQGNYDCIVPGSGGKDSAFTAHILKYKYQMNPLTVTWAPHLYTEVGFKNFQSWIHSGFDNLLVTPNGKIHRLLTKLAFENLFHPFQPFIIGQRQIAPKFSEKYGIPLIFYGENQAEYGNNIAENETPLMDSKFYRADADLRTLMLAGKSAAEIMQEYRLSAADLQPYQPANAERLEAIGTQVHYLGYYLPWDPQECYYYAAENTGFVANTERTEGSYSKYSSIDDKIDPLHYFTTYIKFGIGRATYDAAQEIRNNKITREEGVALVKKYDAEFPKKYFQEILQYLSITAERFWELTDLARSPHLWRKDDDKGWQLRAAVWMS